MVYYDITKNITSGNITTSISDHLTQYLVAPNKHSTVPLQTKENVIFVNTFTIKSSKMKSI